MCNENVPHKTENEGYITKDSGARQSFGTGAVRDIQDGKGRYDLIPTKMLKRLAGLYQRGAEKYDANNWRLGIPQSRFMDSAFRHMCQFLEGDRSEDHLAAVIFNIAGVMEMEEGVADGTYPGELDDLYNSPTRKEREDGEGK